MSWMEKERSRIRAARIDNLRGLLSIRRTDRVPNVWVKELCRVMKGLDEELIRVRPCGEDGK